jgi:H+/Cl- antiporter ClcA
MPCWSQHRTRPILFGYAAAAVAAGRSLMLQRLFIPPPRTNPQLDYLSIDYVFMLGAFAIVFSGLYAAPFAAALVYFAERYRIRSAFYCAIGGAITGMLVLLLIRLGYSDRDLGTYRLLFVASLVAGLVFWLVAGRSAGRT